MNKTNAKDWKSFHLKSLKQDSYPKYPQELMLKTIFGRDSKFNLFINKKSKIVDIGCGFGNNLIPFIDVGASVYGVEIDKGVCSVTKKILKKKFPNKQVNIRVGHNRLIPYKDKYFDLVTTNTLHYEKNLKNINKALEEYKRVLKKNKFFYLTTTGNRSDFFKSTNKISNNIYKITNKKDKIRFGQTFFFFENEKFLKKILLKHFSKIIVGRTTHVVNKSCEDYFMALCKL